MGSLLQDVLGLFSKKKFTQPIPYVPSKDDFFVLSTKSDSSLNVMAYLPKVDQTLISAKQFADAIVAGTNTTYDYANADAGGKTNLTLTGSDATVDTVSLVGGTGVTIASTGSDVEFSIAAGTYVECTGTNTAYTIPLWNSTGNCSLIDSGFVFNGVNKYTLDSSRKLEVSWLEMADVPSIINLSNGTGTAGQVLTRGASNTLEWTTNGTGSMSSWGLDADTGTVQEINDGNTVTIAGGVKLSTSVAGTTVTLNHNATTRVDTTSTATPAGGGTFTVVDSITQDATGHPIAVNVKTVTMPASAGNTTYDLTGAANGSNYEVKLTGSDATVDTISFNAGGGVTLTDEGGGNVKINVPEGTVTSVAGGLGTTVTGTGTIAPVVNIDYAGNNNAIIIAPTETPVAADYIWFSDTSDNGDIKKSLVSSLPGGGASGVTQIVGGTNVTVSPAGGTGVVTVNSTDEYTGTVTAVNTSNGTFVNVTGGSITNTGTITGDLSATGTASATTYLRGDNTWATIPAGNTTYDLSVPDATTNIALDGSDGTSDIVTITGGANIDVTRVSTSELKIDATGLCTGWTMQDGKGGSEVVACGDTVTFDGGIAISTVVSATDTVTFNHNNIGTAGTYAYPTSVVTNAQGHITSIVAGSAPVGITLTVTGTGASTFNAATGALNIPTPVIPAVPFTSLTTAGNSGLATLTAGVLNIPQYGGASGPVTTVTGTAPIVSSGGTSPAISINSMTAASAGSGGLKGAVPDSNAGDQDKFLKADATWAVIPASGTVTSLTTTGNTTATLVGGVLNIPTSLQDFGLQSATASTGTPLTGILTNVQYLLTPRMYAGTTNIGFVPTGGTDKLFLRGDGTWVDPISSFTIPTMTTTVLGGGKLASDVVQSIAFNTITETASRTYGTQFNAAGQLVVNVPWTAGGSGTMDAWNLLADSGITSVIADNNNVRINGAEGISTVGVATDTVQINLDLMTTTLKGGGKLGSTLTKAIDGASPELDARTYGIHKTAGDQLAVYVPWSSGGGGGISSVTTTTASSTGSPLTASISGSVLTINSFAYGGGTNLGFVPSGGGGNQKLSLRGDGSWALASGTAYTASNGITLNTANFEVDYLGTDNVVLTAPVVAASEGRDSILINDISDSNNVKSIQLQNVVGIDISKNLTLTTNNTSGAATLSGSTLNIPQYSGGGGGGEVNTASNVGSATEVFKQKSGVDLQFRTLTSVDGSVLFTQNADTIDFAAESQNVVDTIASGKAYDKFTSGGEDGNAMTGNKYKIMGSSSIDAVEVYSPFNLNWTDSNISVENNSTKGNITHIKNPKGTSNSWTNGDIVSTTTVSGSGSGLTLKVLGVTGGPPGEVQASPNGFAIQTSGSGYQIGDTFNIIPTSGGNSVLGTVTNINNYQLPNLQSQECIMLPPTLKINDTIEILWTVTNSRSGGSQVFNIGIGWFDTTTMNGSTSYLSDFATSATFNGIEFGRELGIGSTKCTLTRDVAGQGYVAFGYNFPTAQTNDQYNISWTIKTTRAV